MSFDFDVFVSFPMERAEEARLIVKQLEANGLRTYLDLDDPEAQILARSDATRSQVEAHLDSRLARSRRLLLCWFSGSMSVDWCRYEYVHFELAHKEVVALVDDSMQEGLVRLLITRRA